MPLISKFRASFDLNHKPSRRKAVIWFTVGGWLSNGIIMIQGLLLIPLYIKYLGADMYGFWLASGGMLAWLSMVDVGGAAITRQRCANAYGKGDLQRLVDYFWHGALVMLGVITVFLVLLFAFSPLIPQAIRADEELRPILLTCLLISGVGTALNFARMFLREFASAAQRNGLPAVATLVGLILALGFTIVGLTVYDLGLYALAIATVIRSGVPLLMNALGAGLLLTSVKYRNSWSKTIFRDYWVTTPAVLSAKAAGVFSQQLPVVLLTRWAGPEVTVAYSVSIRLLEMAKHFINHPLAALYGASAHLFGDAAVTPERKRALFRQIASGFSAATTGAFAYYVLVNQGFIHLWIAPDKYLGPAFTVVAALAMLLQLRNQLYTNFIGSHGAIQISGYSSALEKLITVAVQCVLIYHFAALGAVASLVLVAVVFQFPYHVILKNRQPEAARSLRPLQWLWLPALAVFWIVSAGSAWLVFDDWMAFLLCCGLAAVLPGALMIASLPNLRERLWMLKQRIKPRFP